MSDQTETTYNCANCNAELEVPPGSTELTCPYCNHKESIGRTGEIREIDFHEYLKQASAQSNESTIEFLSCDGCGANITVDENTHSDQCPYCGKSYVTTAPQSDSIIAPESLLTFSVTKEKAIESYRDWVKKRWFAPNDFKRAAQKNDSLEGVYLPHWTFDSSTQSEYTGKRGIDYYVTERYTTTENGKTVTKTRQVRKTRWYYTSGRVSRSFDDVITPASNTLPEKYVKELEPWDLHALVPFDSAYLQGYRSERYSIDLESGFENAKDDMEEEIRADVRRDIGGDRQIITGLWTQYDDITFKHILLPVWVTAYRFNDRAFRIVINARTGEVQGERPWSWLKITGAVLVLLMIIGTIVYYSNM